jgi:hypothetical protein
MKDKEVYTYIEFNSRELYIVTQDFNLYLTDGCNKNIEAGTIFRIITLEEIHSGIYIYEMICYDTVDCDKFEIKNTHRHLSVIHARYKFYMSSLLNLKFIKLGNILNHIIYYLNEFNIKLDYKFVKKIDKEFLQIIVPDILEFGNNGSSILSFEYFVYSDSVSICLDGSKLISGIPCTWDKYDINKNRDTLRNIYYEFILLPSVL